MPHRPAARATAAARSLAGRPPAGRTICCALAAAAALDAAAATPAAARPTHPRPAHSAHGRPAHETSAHGRSEHAPSGRASHVRGGRGHAERGRHAKTARAARVVRLYERAAADEPAVVPPLPTIPTFDLAVSGAVGGAAAGRAPAAPARLSAAPAASLGAALGAPLGSDTLAGRSGKLRARFVVATAAVAGAARSVASYFPYLRRLFGDTAARVAPGVYPTPDGPTPDGPTPDGAAGEGRPAFAFINMLPFSEKVAGRIGSYNMGFWPGETSGRGGAAYSNPAGFIEVTAANQATYVSEHFRLGDFLTHDQQDVWPKYLVLHEQLLDKLELVLDDLRAHGYQADRLHVMSGFRTPQYNQTGGDPSGRAELSRHQYGDAADVWVENGGGEMADLNGDGRVDARDAAILAEAAGRVEDAHPELTGGVGIYRGNGAHGPFVHIDTRGRRARWGHA